MEAKVNASNEDKTQGKEELKSKDQAKKSNESVTKEKEKSKEKKNYRKLLKQMSDEDLEKLFKKAQERDFYLQSLQKTKADCDNYQKRRDKEFKTRIEYANQDLLSSLLGNLDILEKAINSVSESEVNKNFYEGICLVYKEFHKTLENFGVTTINALKKAFDPKYHEAVFQKEMDEYPDMTIIEEYQKGFMFKERLLRASKVIVSRKPEISEPKQEKKADKEENKESKSNIEEKNSQ